MGKTNDDQFGEKEAKARFEAALKGAMNTRREPPEGKTRR